MNMKKIIIFTFCLFFGSQEVFGGVGDFFKFLTRSLASGYKGSDCIDHPDTLLSDLRKMDPQTHLNPWYWRLNQFGAGTIDQQIAALQGTLKYKQRHDAAMVNNITAVRNNQAGWVLSLYNQWHNGNMTTTGNSVVAQMRPSDFESDTTSNYQQQIASLETAKRYVKSLYDDIWGCMSNRNKYEMLKSIHEKGPQTSEEFDCAYDTHSKLKKMFDVVADQINATERVYKAPQAIEQLRNQNVLGNRTRYDEQYNPLWWRNTFTSLNAFGRSAVGAGYSFSGMVTHVLANAPGMQEYAYIAAPAYLLAAGGLTYQKCWKTLATATILCLAIAAARST